MGLLCPKKKEIKRIYVYTHSLIECVLSILVLGFRRTTVWAYSRLAVIKCIHLQKKNKTCNMFIRALCIIHARYESAKMIIQELNFLEGFLHEFSLTGFKVNAVDWLVGWFIDCGFTSVIHHMDSLKSKYHMLKGNVMYIMYIYWSVQLCTWFIHNNNIF